LVFSPLPTRIFNFARKKIWINNIFNNRLSFSLAIEKNRKPKKSTGRLNVFHDSSTTFQTPQKGHAIFFRQPRLIISTLAIEQTYLVVTDVERIRQLSITPIAKVYTRVPYRLVRIIHRHAPQIQLLRMRTKRDVQPYLHHVGAQFPVGVGEYFRWHWAEDVTRPHGALGFSPIPRPDRILYEKLMA
jgi:hypothetical protein